MDQGLKQIVLMIMSWFIRHLIVGSNIIVLQAMRYRIGIACLQDAVHYLIPWRRHAHHAQEEKVLETPTLPRQNGVILAPVDS